MVSGTTRLGKPLLEHPPVCRFCYSGAKKLNALGYAKFAVKYLFYSTGNKCKGLMLN